MKEILTDKMLKDEAKRRYGEMTGGQYQAARPIDIDRFYKGAKWINDMYSSSLTTLRKRVEELEELAKVTEDLAAWSIKYPRGRIYGMSRQPDMDNQLIELEKRAVLLTARKDQSVKCGKCEMLGDSAPCDECYRNNTARNG